MVTELIMKRTLLVVLAIVLIPVAPLHEFARSANQEPFAELHFSRLSADKVYTPEEVDKAADLKNIDAVLSEFESRMRCKREGITTISVVLCKTRIVTDVKVETTTGCRVPAKAIAALRKIRFTPALKDGRPVSQLYEIDIKQELRAMPNVQCMPTQ
jgi:hypothetical protein